jgi:cyclomaltodextrinase / maltogenic alpha-amylase / neopullulanase
VNTSALLHQGRSPHAYPVGEDHLRVVFRAARGDLARAVCVYGHRYAWPPEADSSVPMERLGDDGTHEYWGVTLPAPTRRVRYTFYVQGKDGGSVWLTDRGLSPIRPQGGYFEYAYIHRGDRFQQPDWLRQAVFYQIFPDRFCNGDPASDPPAKLPWGEKPGPQSMAGGDLAGIQQKLAYLKRLGVGCIYTTPIFRSPTNHKYDTADYYQIDPVFGTSDQFRELVQAAHARGIKFMLDAVFNHSGKEWFPFIDLMAKGAGSAYADWFYDLHGFPVDPAACNYETFADGVANMPKLNTTNPDLAEYLLDVAAHWIREAGIDGWRLDVANEVDHGFWRAFRARVKAAKPEAFILGEIWHDATDWLQGDQFDSVMNYPWREVTLAFLKGEIDAVGYDRQLTRLRFRYPAEVVRGLLNLLGSHDTPRVRTVLGSREKAAQAAVLLLTAEGVPMIYYGDEIGMEGGPDPDCRRCYPWAKPGEQDTAILALYRRLTEIRQRFPWLNDGAWETFTADPVTNVLGFRRSAAPLVAPLEQRAAGARADLYVVINGAAAPATVAIPSPADADLVDLLEGQMLTGQVTGRTLTLPPRGFAILAPAKLAGRRGRGRK